MLVLGFYDGPTSGLLQCSTCSAIYAFDMLDWSEDHRARVFRLAALPSNALVEIEEALAPTEAPRWPVWIPWFRQQPPAKVREALTHKLQQLLRRAQPAELLVAWTDYGESVIAAT